MCVLAHAREHKYNMFYDNIPSCAVLCYVMFINFVLCLDCHWSTSTYFVDEVIIWKQDVTVVISQTVVVQGSVHIHSLLL